MHELWRRQLFHEDGVVDEHRGVAINKPLQDAVLVGQHRHICFDYFIGFPRHVGLVATAVIVGRLDDRSDTYGVRFGVIDVREGRFHPDGRLSFLLPKMALGQLLLEIQDYRICFLLLTMRLLLITSLGRLFFHLLVLLILLVYRRRRVLVEVVFGLLMVRNPGLSVSLVTSFGRVVPARDGFIMHSSNWSSRHRFMVVRIVHRRVILVLRLPPVLIIFIIVVRVGNHGLQVKSPHRHNWLIRLPNAF